MTCELAYLLRVDRLEFVSHAGRVQAVIQSFSQSVGTASGGNHAACLSIQLTQSAHSCAVPYRLSGLRLGNDRGEAERERGKGKGGDARSVHGHGKALRASVHAHCYSSVKDRRGRKNQTVHTTECKKKGELGHRERDGTRGERNHREEGRTRS